VKIARRFKLKDPKFDDYCDPSVFSDWLADIEYYFDWYPDEAKFLFARKKLVR